jgi:hypothetical protein
MRQFKRGVVKLTHTLANAKQLVQAVRNYDVQYRELQDDTVGNKLAKEHLTAAQRDTLADLADWAVTQRAVLEGYLLTLNGDS